VVLIVCLLRVFGISVDSDGVLMINGSAYLAIRTADFIGSFMEAVLIGIDDIPVLVIAINVNDIAAGIEGIANAIANIAVG
jgi:hypothetical protein